MIRRVLLAIAAVLVPVASFGVLTRRASRRLLVAPRTTPDEARLGPSLDALGGEVVRIRSRDGLRLSARWLAAERDDPTWTTDAHEAILLLHGWSGSIAPDLVEYGPYLRRTAGVLGLDFRGHGGSDDSPTTFGLREVDDVAGALAWLGERGIERVALGGSRRPTQRRPSGRSRGIRVAHVEPPARPIPPYPRGRHIIAPPVHVPVEPRASLED